MNPVTDPENVTLLRRIDHLTYVTMRAYEKGIKVGKEKTSHTTFFEKIHPLSIAYLIS